MQWTAFVLPVTIALATNDPMHGRRSRSQAELSINLQGRPDHATHVELGNGNLAGPQPERLPQRRVLDEL